MQYKKAKKTQIDHIFLNADLMQNYTLIPSFNFKTQLFPATKFPQDCLKNYDFIYNFSKNVFSNLRILKEPDGPNMIIHC